MLSGRDSTKRSWPSSQGRPELGQPAHHLYPRLRPGHGAGERGQSPSGQPHSVHQGLPTGFLDARRTNHHRAADLLRHSVERLRDRRRPSKEFDYPSGSCKGCDQYTTLDRHLRHQARHAAGQIALRGQVRRPEHAHQQPDHGQQPAALQPLHPGADPAPSLRSCARQGPVPGRHIDGTPGLRPGRLHDQRVLPGRQHL
jgi:hypothetical protein